MMKSALLFLFAFVVLVSAGTVTLDLSTVALCTTQCDVSDLVDSLSTTDDVVVTTSTAGAYRVAISEQYQINSLTLISTATANVTVQVDSTMLDIGTLNVDIFSTFSVGNTADINEGVATIAGRLILGAAGELITQFGLNLTSTSVTTLTGESSLLALGSESYFNGAISTDTSGGVIFSGTIYFDGTKVTGGAGGLQASIQGNTVFNVINGGFTWIAFFLGNMAGADLTLNIPAGITVYTDTTADLGGQTPSFTIQGPGTFSVNGEMHVGAGNVNIGNDAIVNLDGGLSGSGTVEIASGCTFLLLGNNTFTGTFTTAGNVTVLGTSVFTNAYSQGAGTLHLSNGALVSSNIVIGAAVTGNGVIQGTSTTLTGLVSPGNSPGTINVDGDLNLAGATVVMEIDSATSYDQFIVSGTATLSGSLSLDFNYKPAVGTQYTFITAKSVTGAFSHITSTGTVQTTSTTVTVVSGSGAGAGLSSTDSSSSASVITTACAGLVVASFAALFL